MNLGITRVFVLCVVSISAVAIAMALGIIMITVPHDKHWLEVVTFFICFLAFITSPRELKPVLRLMAAKKTILHKTLHVSPATPSSLPFEISESCSLLVAVMPRNCSPDLLVGKVMLLDTSGGRSKIVTQIDFPRVKLARYVGQGRWPVFTSASTQRGSFQLDFEVVFNEALRTKICFDRSEVEFEVLVKERRSN